MIFIDKTLPFYLLFNNIFFNWTLNSKSRYITKVFSYYPQMIFRLLTNHLKYTDDICSVLSKLVNSLRLDLRNI